MLKRCPLCDKTERRYSFYSAGQGALHFPYLSIILILFSYFSCAVRVEDNGIVGMGGAESFEQVEITVIKEDR